MTKTNRIKSTYIVFALAATAACGSQETAEEEFAARCEERP